MLGTFLIIYIIGVILSIVCICYCTYWKCKEITLGDIVFSLIVSIASWITIFIYGGITLIWELDSIVIFKKKNK